jgi:hypothetical protein
MKYIRKENESCMYINHHMFMARCFELLARLINVDTKNARAR